MNKLSKTINPEAIEDRSISFSKLKYDVSEGIASNLKTVGGQSLLGEGDIPISGGTISGGSSSGNGAYSEVYHGTSDTTFKLTSNAFHVWDEVSTLTLTLELETAGIANEFLFQFTSGATATSLTLPDTIKWVGGEGPTIEVNKIYQISILKGLASVLEWDNATVIKDNFISISSNTLTFEYPTASKLTIDVSGRTTGMPSSYTLTIPSGVSSYTASNLTMILYINSVTPSSDDKYNYTYTEL